MDGNGEMLVYHVMIWFMIQLKDHFKMDVRVTSRTLFFHPKNDVLYIIIVFLKLLYNPKIFATLMQ